VVLLPGAVNVPGGVTADRAAVASADLGAGAAIGTRAAAAGAAQSPLGNRQRIGSHMLSEGNTAAFISNLEVFFKIYKINKLVRYSRDLTFYAMTCHLYHAMTPKLESKCQWFMSNNI